MEQEQVEYFEAAMEACVGHPHERELMELLVSQMSDLTSTHFADTSRDQTSD